MISTVNLNDNLTSTEQEIDNIITYYMLTYASFTKCATFGQRPKGRFCLSHIITIAFGISP